MAAVLLFVLLVALALPLGWMFSGSLFVSGKPVFHPSMPIPKGVDANGDRIDDRLGLEIAERVSNGTAGEPVNVIVMLSVDSGLSAAAFFRAHGGFVTTGIWNQALYGFGGRIPFGRVVGFVNSCSDVLLVEKDIEVT